MPFGNQHLEVGAKRIPPFEGVGLAIGGGALVIAGDRCGGMDIEAPVQDGVDGFGLDTIDP